MDRREFLKLSLMAGLGAMFGPQLLAATKEKLIITDWLHFEFAGELQPSTVAMLQQTITQEIKDYLALHPTHKLVTITNQWASETGKRVALTPEQIRDWKHFYEIQDAAINYQETAHIEYAADRGNLSEPYGVVHHEISYAIHNPDRAHLIVEDVQPHEAPFIPDVDPTWDKNRRDHSERKHGKPNGSQESLCDFTQHPKTWSDDETTV